VEENSTKLFDYKKRFYQIPIMLEILPSRLVNNIPFVIEYESIGKIYILNEIQSCDEITSEFLYS
jgi:hypothetical protein